MTVPLLPADLGLAAHPHARVFHGAGQCFFVRGRGVVAGHLKERLFGRDTVSYPDLRHRACACDLEISPPTQFGQSALQPDPPRRSGAHRVIA